MDFNQMVGAYVQLRDKKKEIKDRHTEELKPYNEALDQLEQAMLAALNQTGQENAKTKTGTVYKITEHTVSIQDKDVFRRYVIGGELWEMIDWKANKSEVADLVDTTGQPPPGVAYAKRIGVGVRRANSK